jgi:hypothetical protein
MRLTAIYRSRRTSRSPALPDPLLVGQLARTVLPSCRAIMPPVARARPGIVDGEASRPVAASHCRLLPSSPVPSRVLVVGYALPTHFPEIGHKENLYGSEPPSSRLGAGRDPRPRLGPALRLSLKPDQATTLRGSTDDFGRRPCPKASGNASAIFTHDPATVECNSSVMSRSSCPTRRTISG